MKILPYRRNCYLQQYSYTNYTIWNWKQFNTLTLSIHFLFIDSIFLIILKCILHINILCIFSVYYYSWEKKLMTLYHSILSSHKIFQFCIINRFLWPMIIVTCAATGVDGFIIKTPDKINLYSFLRRHRNSHEFFFSSIYCSLCCSMILYRSFRISGFMKIFLVPLDSVF